MERRQPPAVVGLLPHGGWVGLVTDGQDYGLGFGRPNGGLVVDVAGAAGARAALVALAVVYFEEALDEAPPSAFEGTAVEATHQDMAELIRWLIATARGEEEKRLAREALDSVEDGLPGDAVALRLMPLLEGEPGSPAPMANPDPVGLLLARERALVGDGS